MMRLLLLSSALLVAASVSADTCPGGRVRCPDFMTCCQLTGDDFGCCPFPDAKCCADHVHCCPHNMDCDVAHQSCVMKGSSVQFYWQVPLHPEIVEPVVPKKTPEQQEKQENGLQQFKENECPDKTKCHSAFTCCKMYSGKYGCCPFDNGTCCQDGFHCCPHGSKCSASGECSSTEMNYTVNAYPLKDKKFDKLLKTQQDSRKPHHEDVSDPGGLCPDGHPCPEKYTCCKIKGKRYGCCPYSEARCCDDGIHCCPKGTNCNITLGTCDIQTNFGRSFPSQPLESLHWSEAAKGALVSNRVEEIIIDDVICPDERYHCPTGSTCCQLTSGSYGCCPMERAICCDDKEHCCPYGFECTVGGCVKGTNRLPPFLWTERSPLERQVVKDKVTEKTDVDEDLSDVICPDQYPCPDRNTCCELASGEYGCCPMDKATCCADKIHCCPHGYRCMSEGCRKDSTSWSLPLTLNATTVSRKSEVVKEKIAEKNDIGEDLSDVICPDQYSCPDRNTCCEMDSGEYGCCPMEKAICCPDKMSCCPHGYYCLDEGCEKNLTSWSLPLTVNATVVSRDSKRKAVKTHQEMLKEDSDVMCPDMKSECPEGSTCCQLASGDYGCCAYEDATCCGDMEHCCPHGYWCSDDGCDRMPGLPKHLTPFLRKLFTAKKIRDDPHSVPSVRLP